MPRYRVTLAYDGTAYAGWQTQPGRDTVQRRLQDALHFLAGGQAVKVHGSGRTDAGVHALGQVAHFDLPRPMPPAALRRALNARLPPDIRALAARRAAPDFHARRSAKGKEYRYFIWQGEVLPPLLRNTRAHVRRPLDAAAMRAAAALLRGRRDFAAFTANPDRVVETTVRHLRRLSVARRGREIVIRAEADGFLYRMVRSLAGWLIRVGEGAEPAARTRDVLAAAERTAHVPTAPPQGLFLWHVRY